jgi:hypothetical protein
MIFAHRPARLQREAGGIDSLESISGLFISLKNTVSGPRGGLVDLPSKDFNLLWPKIKLSL